MPTSYNGWPASESPYAINVDQNFVAAGQKFPAGVKAGPVSTIFRALVEFLHAEVEPIVPGWNWGYYYRATTGGTSLSCHASATAIDYNAPNHPYGVRGTWSAEQVRKVDAFLAGPLGGVVRWGEHYSGNVDGMHFEINDTAAAVAAVAARLTTPEDPMAQYEDQLAEIARKQDQTLKEVRAFRAGKAKNDAKVRQALARLEREAKDDATKSQARQIIALFNEGKDDEA